MVSIVIITYNRSKLLLKTLKSILSQSVKDLEILVIDDGSDDDTFDMINSLNDMRIKYFNFGRIGNLSKLRNLGIKHSSYDLIAFCDDDDLWYPDKLKKQMIFMDKYEFVCSNAAVIDINDNIIKEKYFDDIYSTFEIDRIFLLSQGNCILTSSCLVNKKIFTESNEYFDELKFTNYCEDYELFIRLTKNYKILFIDENLILKREHASVSGGLDNILKMLKTSIDILNLYRSIELNLPDSLPIEGILGFKILRIKYAFKKNIFTGISESTNFIVFLMGKGVLSVFIKKKVARKIRKILNINHSNLQTEK